MDGVQKSSKILTFKNRPTKFESKCVLFSEDVTKNGILPSKSEMTGGQSKPLLELLTNSKIEKILASRGIIQEALKSIDNIKQQS